MNGNAHENHGAGRRLGRALVALLAAATVTSWTQWAAVTVRREIFGQFSWKWWLHDQLFLSSAGYLLLLTALALVPIAAHLLWPRRYSFAALAATLAGLGAFCVLLIFERISYLAWLAVALGVGVQVYRIMKPRSAAAWRWTRRVAILGNLATVIVVIVAARARQATEANAMRALPAARREAPNVLPLIMDTERAQSMSLYGAPEETTPHQDAWGRTGVVFDAAFTTSSWTLPSHASMFTGHYPSQIGADYLAPLDATYPTLADVFRDHGYATAGFVANVTYTGYRSGIERGFIRYEDTKRSLRQMLLGTTLMQFGSMLRTLNMWGETHWITGTLRSLWPLLAPRGADPMSDLKRAEEVTGDFLGWLPILKGRPFFAFLNLFDAHGPYLPPLRYRTMFDPALTPYGRYRGAIRYMDDTVETLLRELDRRGLLQTTIVVITSDHGELFGEHGLTGHGNGLYRPQLQVPLLVLNAPGAVPGTRVRQNVSLRDLAVTLLDFAAIPNQAGLGGTSLRPLLAGAASLPTASPVLSEISPGTRIRALRVVKSELKSLIDDSSHVIESAEGEFKLFAYPADSAEGHDLANSAAARQAAAGRLRRIMERQGITWKGGPALSPAPAAPGTTPPSRAARPRN